MSTAAGVLVADVIAALCAKAGLPASKIDVAALGDERVQGYTVAARTSARAAIEQLMTAAGLYAVEAGDKIRFRRLADAPYAGVIESKHLGFAALDDADAPRAISRGVERDLPRAVEVAFADPTEGYRVNVRAAHRLDTPSEQVASIQLPVVMPPDRAAQLAQSLITRAWLGQLTTEISLPADYAHLEAGDVVDVDGRRWQITRLRYDAPLALRLSLVRFEYNAHAQVSAPPVAEVRFEATPASASAPVKLAAPGLVLLDAPLLSSETDAPGFYAIAYPRPGEPAAATATLAMRRSRAEAWQAVASLPVRGAVGTLLSSLPAADASTYDAGATLSVRLDSAGRLTGTTREAALRSENRALIVSSTGACEVLAFAGATETSPGVFLLTGLARNLAGEAPGAGVGARFVLLSTAGAVVNVAQALGDEGAALEYALVAASGDAGGAVPVRFANSNRRLRPLPVAHLTALHDSTAWQVRWSRQARKATTWRDGADVPLDQPAREYEVELLDGAGAPVPGGSYTTNTEAATLPDAAALRVRVRQIGAYGPGPWREVSATR